MKGGGGGGEVNIWRDNRRFIVSFNQNPGQMN